MVNDNGIGIKAEDLGKLFKEFAPLDSGTTRRHEGTGLGLAICQRIIQAHGGSIWAENAKPKGAVFTFVIPKEVSSGAVSPFVAVDA